MTSTSTIEDTMALYQSTRTSYGTLLASVYAETDSAKRNLLILEVQAQNRVLVNIAQTLMSQWEALARTPATNQSLSELQNDLEQYRQDLETMKGVKDETTKLSMMYANITGDVSANRTVYYFYIVVVFVLLLLVFVLFALRSVLGGVASTIESVLEPSSASGTGGI